MKLRNKKTGEIINKYPECFVINSGEQIYHYDSIAELNEEWEDYEELKEIGYWYYDTTVNRPDFIENCNVTDEDKKLDKQIGNYFETREEAEKAVEKLKAWQRLKDKGFKVDLWEYDGGNYQERIRTGRILFRIKDHEENDKDLDLLFGGEE